MKRFIAVVGLVLILSGCVKTVYIDENGNEIVPPQSQKTVYVAGTEGQFEVVREIGSYLEEIRDTTTGVHYYLYKLSSSSGYSGLSPIYEADGSIRVTN